MTKPKFKKDDRVLYANGSGGKTEAKVLMLNSARPSYDNGPFYDIEVYGGMGMTSLYTVHESRLQPLMSDPKLARLIAHNYAQAQYHLDEARKSLKAAKDYLVEDGQPDYELTMVKEFEIVVKNTLRFELTNEISRWDEITKYRKESN